MGNRKKSRSRRADREVWEALMMVLQFGINMIVPICMCVLIGVWIGNRTGAKWVVVPLFFVGALAGGTNIYKMSKRLMKDDKDHVKKD